MATFPNKIIGKNIFLDKIGIQFQTYLYHINPFQGENITTPDGRSYTEEEFNTVKEAMMDVYKRIKNNDLDFLLDDYDMDSSANDDLATAEYEDDEDEDDDE